MSDIRLWGIFAVLLIFGYCVPKAEERVARSAREGASAAIIASATYDETICDDRKKRLLVRIENVSAETIVRSIFQVEARLPDFSDNVLSYDAQFDTDRILEPQEVWINCFVTPSLATDKVAELAELEWSILPQSIELLEEER